MQVKTATTPAYTAIAAQAILDSLVNGTTMALLSDCTIGLLSNPGFNPTPTTATSLFLASEATFSGYARVPGTFGGVINLSPGLQGIIAQAQFEVATADPQVQNTIYGAFVINVDGVAVYEKFVTNLPNMALPGDLLLYVAAAPMTNVQPTGVV